jgi:hypothetical protein
MIKAACAIAAATVAAALTLVLASASFGGQPVTQTLNPEPPSFYTCMAVGNGTICRGTRTEVVDPHPDVTCPDGVTLLDQGTDHLDATRYYDSNGNLTRRVLRDQWTDAQKTNPLTGLTAPYTQYTITTDVLGVPGDFSSATETVTGQAIITLPGYGAVFMPVGRSVTDPEGVTIFQAGPPATVTDPRFAELCTALGAN